MIEIVLVGVIIILFVFLAWHGHEGRIERAKLINALLSKNAQELANLEMADKTKIKVKVPKQPDEIPLDSLPQKEWEEAIKQ